MSDDLELFFFNEFINTSSDDSSDDDSELLLAAALVLYDNQQSSMSRFRGSIRGHAMLDRNRFAAHVQLYNDYFNPEHTLYTPDQFRRRFRMRRDLFNRIVEGVTTHDAYFKLRPDATGKLGFSPIQKCTAAVRMLAYGVAGDLIDEHLRMGESTCLEAMYRFCKAVVAVFGGEYLRGPNAEDTARLMAVGSERGFPGMLGSIDCMHWEWKNCPFAWQGMYKGHVEGCTVILEAVASHDLWIWHSFFGMAGSHNDINVLQRSPVFSRLVEGQTPECNFEINGHHYTKGYYLADGIYPRWSTFVKTISVPNTNKKRAFAKEQEGCRKDVERAFGVLQARWAIVRHPARTWSVDTMWEVMTACVIMHNMIVEDEREGANEIEGWDFQGPLAEPVHAPQEFEAFLQMHREIRDQDTHNQLQEDLVEHIWRHKGNQ